MLIFEGQLLLQLHHRDAHEHSGMWNPEIPSGNGVILWFRTDDFNDAVERVRAIGAEIVTEAHVNPNADQHEIWLRDLDGYLVVLSDNIGDAKSSH